MHLSFQRMVQFFCIPSIKKETTNLVTKELRAYKKYLDTLVQNILREGTMSFLKTSING